MLWLSQEEARLLRPFGEKSTIDKTSCAAEHADAGLPDGFHQNDRTILCKIWSDPALAGHFSKKVPEQRATFLVAAAIFAWYAFMSFSLLREWLAQRELSVLMEEIKIESADVA